MSPAAGEDAGQQFDPRPILAVLERHCAEYVVVSGDVAVLPGAQRPTKDVDVVPAATQEHPTRECSLTQPPLHVVCRAVPSHPLLPPRGVPSQGPGPEVLDPAARQGRDDNG